VDRLAKQGLDGSTIRNAIMPLRVLYKRAKRAGQIPVNPTSDLEFIAPRNKPKRVVAPDDAATRLAALTLPDRAIWATALYAGLRKGELQALSIEDVELFPEGRWGLIHVRQTWDKVEGAQEPKSAAGTRTVPIPEQLYEILSSIDRAEGLILGKDAETPFNYMTLRERTERVWRKAGLEHSNLQLHEGRHSYKTFLEATEIRDSRIDRYMGHANHTVQARYSHQLDAKYLDDAQALSEYLRLADTPSRAEEVRDNRATVRDTP
jgi:integrase